MRIWQVARGLGALTAVAVALWGCDLDIENPNEPSSVVLTDPNVLETVAAGTMRSWFNNYTTLNQTLVLSVQSKGLSSSWNNGNMNYYGGIDINPSDTASDPLTWSRALRPWTNDLSAAGRTSIEEGWFGMYSTLSAANDALKAIRAGGIIIGDAARTKRAETIAQLMQGASLAYIALNYDQGYVIDENTDVIAVQRVSRKELKTAALAAFDAAIALANANTFTTLPAWTNEAETYTNTDIAKIANTMAAMLLAWYPRDATEAADASVVDWARVETYAAAGMSTGGDAITFALIGDGCTAWCQGAMPWFTDWSTGRISTRLAHFLDPKTQMDPYALGIGSPQPSSPDLRLGDGSYGTDALVSVYDNIPKTATGGTDFAYSFTAEIMRPDRGFYAQSNIGYPRWDESGNQDTQLQWGGFGYSPVITHHMNDLLWAEALLRQGKAGAAALINNTRVGRGGLPAASEADPLGSPDDGPCMADDPRTTGVANDGVLAKDGAACTRWSKLLCEQEIEYLQMGPAHWWHHRHLPVVQSTAWQRAGGCVPVNPCPNRQTNGPRFIQGLIPGTAREMPVPAKELAIKAVARRPRGRKRRNEFAAVSHKKRTPARAGVSFLGFHRRRLWSGGRLPNHLDDKGVVRTQPGHRLAGPVISDFLYLRGLEVLENARVTV